jgi:hypothetical protein
MRIDYHKMVPLRQRKTLRMGNIRWLDSDTEQWVTEVETWFMKAYLSGILTIQDGAMFALPNVDAGFSPEYMRDWRLCGRILFHNQDFTNINWVGFFITIAACILVILVGSQVETTHKCLRYCVERIIHLKKWAGLLRHPRRSARRIWNVALLFQYLSRVRPWHSSNT